MILARILLIGDDVKAAQIWSFALKMAGIETTLVLPSDKDDTERRTDPSYDLIIIDAHSPPLSRASLIRHLREEASIPILLMLPTSDELYVLEGYESGADDVIVNSISHKVFLAKVTVWLRRSWTVPTSMLDSFYVGDLLLDTNKRQLVDATGKVTKLTSLEFRLLHLLMSHADHVMESALIVDRVWGTNGQGDSTLLKNLVYRLRRKIEPDPSIPLYIVSMAGEGYMFRSTPIE